ncbi:MAG: DUF1592 domain-containing protein [Candidatus Aminicenantes bacterium]|nr:DUF1592 domain-containing protein [Candidatus Aminicenantes bacterium]
MPFFRRFARVSLLVLWSSAAANLAAGTGGDVFRELADEYRDRIRPLTQEYCLSCHSTEQQVGELDLEQFATLTDVRGGTKSWLKVIEMLDNGEMPPGFAKQPASGQKRQLRDWVDRYLQAESLANAGDPGPVVLRRLNNAEYTYTIRDLTGIDLDPAREFPTDSAAGEGFTNTGNALVMSPALLRKYLDAGKEIASHAVLLPDGFRFSPHSTRRDWTDEVLARIRGLYGRYVETADFGVGSAVGNLAVHSDTRMGLAGRLPLEEYLSTTLSERDALKSGRKDIGTVARERGLSAKYLDTLWTRLAAPESTLLLNDLRAAWKTAGPEDASFLADRIRAWQKGLWTFGPVGLIGRKGGPSRWMEPVNPLVTEKKVCFSLPQFADGREPEDFVFSLVAGDAGDGNDNDFVVWQEPRLVAHGRPDILLRDVRRLARSLEGVDGGGASGWGVDPELFGRHPDGRAIDANSLCVQAPSVIQVRIPGRLAAGYDFVTHAVLERQTGKEGSVQVDLLPGTASAPSGLLPSQVMVTFSRVTQVFSESRAVSFLRPILIASETPMRARMEAAFDEHRKLFPSALCYNQIVPVDEVLTINLFYREDDHLARLMLEPEEEARLDRLWDELHYVSHSAFQRVLALDLLMEAFQGNGLEDRSQYEAVIPLRQLYDADDAKFRKRLLRDEPVQLDALVDFAARAYRRPLSAGEKDRLRGLYRRLRDEEMDHEEAFRLTLARMLVSAPFLYRLEEAPAGSGGPVSDWELANRLSYFLWSSLPDEELRSLAAAGRLQDPEVLSQQARRLLGSPRVRRLATEFACQWLHIHEFDTLDEKSERHFPEFADLRTDMYEESIRFFTDLFRRDASLLTLLDSDHTFLNQRLARFYGVEGVEGEDWRRVEGVRSQGRGGILGLATTLARQSGASRTSPILRGNWVSEVLLGEKLPRPPQDVPQLPPDEIATDGLTVRELVARHSSDPQCSGCHLKIDPFGFALEGYDAIGRRRQHDLGGRVIDTRTTLPDGTEIDGLSGLRDYLVRKRRDAIFGQFYRKLLGYAVAREVQLSDQPLLNEIRDRMAENDYRFSVAVDMIVRSRQFREIRGRELQLARSAGAGNLE